MSVCFPPQQLPDAGNWFDLPVGDRNSAWRVQSRGRTATARDDVLSDKDLGMNLSPAIVAPATPPATTDTGRIRLGGGWRLLPATPATR
jgi:hypothetical protein